MSFRKNAFNCGFYIDLYKTISTLTSQSTKSGRFISQSSRFDIGRFYSKREFYRNAKLSWCYSNRRVNLASSNGLFNKSINNSILLPTRFQASGSTPSNEDENKSNLNAKEFLNQERRMNSSFVARQFLNTLNNNELALLKEELLKFEKETAANQSKGFFLIHSII